MRIQAQPPHSERSKANYSRTTVLYDYCVFAAMVGSRRMSGTANDGLDKEERVKSSILGGGRWRVKYQRATSRKLSHYWLLGSVDRRTGKALLQHRVWRFVVRTEATEAQQRTLLFVVGAGMSRLGAVGGLGTRGVMCIGVVVPGIPFWNHAAEAIGFASI